MAVTTQEPGTRPSPAKHVRRGRPRLHTNMVLLPSPTTTAVTLTASLTPGATPRTLTNAGSSATFLNVVSCYAHSNTYKLFGSVNVSVSRIKYSQNRTREMKIIQNVYFFIYQKHPKQEKQRVSIILF